MLDSSPRWSKAYYHFSGLTGKKAFVFAVVLTDRLRKDNWELFQARVGRQDKHSAALKSHQTSQNSCGTSQALHARTKFRWGPRLLLWICSFICSAHTGKELPLFAPFLPEWDPHRAHPFRQKDGSCTRWAASVRQMWVLINSGASNSLPSLFFFSIYTSGADLGKPQNERVLL